MNFGNVKRKRASLREIHLPSILIRYTYIFKVLYKKSFDISKKKKKNLPAILNLQIVSLLFIPVPSSISIQSPDPPRKSTYPPARIISTKLRRESKLLISKSRRHRASLSPFNFQNCGNNRARQPINCETDLSPPLLDRVEEKRERERKKKNVGDCTHARRSGETKALVAWLQGNPIDICTSVTRAVDGGGNKNAAAREKGGTMETQ